MNNVVLMNVEQLHAEADLQLTQIEIPLAIDRVGPVDVPGEYRMASQVHCSIQSQGPDGYPFDAAQLLTDVVGHVAENVHCVQ